MGVSIRDKPFDVVVLKRLRNKGRRLLRVSHISISFDVGGRRPRNWHRGSVRYLAAKFGDLFQEQFSVLWEVEIYQSTHASRDTVTHVDLHSHRCSQLIGHDLGTSPNLLASQIPNQSIEIDDRSTDPG